MKTTLTIILTALASFASSGQALLNEIYTIPGSGKHEFFEFYNTSNAQLTMDHYTMVTYFDDGTKKGFYVMDLPDLNISGRGYFVGSSATPFHYQGISNSNTSHFNWNNNVFLANNNGYIKKWVMSSTIAGDDNPHYDEEALPANFNDFFAKTGGSGATYIVFVYNNGVLSNSFLGGTGGATSVPAYVQSMPSLFIDMSGSSADFGISFSAFATLQPEYVTQDVGTDNGYIRLRDGYCGTWTKSSAQVNHSPGVHNGGAAAEEGQVSVSAVIIRGNSTTGSTIEYDVLSAPLSAFPVTMHIYVDNGTTAGVIDAGDTYIASSTEYSVSDGPFSTVFLPATANVLIQTTTSKGCIDNIRFIPNTGVLPVKLLTFTGNRSSLQWRVEENAAGEFFEVQKSEGGLPFQSIGVIGTTNTPGVEQYRFPITANSRAQYRLKVVNKDRSFFFSNVISVAAGDPGKSLSVVSPAANTLKIQFEGKNGPASVSVYNSSGVLVHSERVRCQGAMQQHSVDLTALPAGSYLVELAGVDSRSVAKFIKN